MSQLSKFLRERLSDRGSQLRLAEALGTSPGTVTKWVSGENTPNFESCLRLADYLGVEPARIFRLTGKMDYYQLYLRAFKRAELQTRLHTRLQNLLDGGHIADVEDVLARLEKASVTKAKKRS